MPPGKKEVKRADFIAWAERYLVPQLGTNVSGIDLYTARCGLLHACSARSSLSDEGKASLIGYAFGKASAADLQSVIDHQRKHRMIALDVDALVTAIQTGYNAWLRDVERDQALIARVNLRGKQVLGDLPASAVDAYRARYQIGDT